MTRLALTPLEMVTSRGASFFRAAAAVITRSEYATNARGVRGEIYQVATGQSTTLNGVLDALASVSPQPLLSPQLSMPAVPNFVQPVTLPLPSKIAFQTPMSLSLLSSKST